MGISRLTVLEIFTNPGDLHIVVSQIDQKWGFLICRSEGRRFKVLIETIGFGEKMEDAIEEVKKTLEAIYEAAAKGLEDAASPLAQQLNSDGEKIDPSKVLNSELILRILDELQQRQVANTEHMLAAAG